MKFKLVNNKVTDEREKALNNKVGAECFYIMIAGTLACLVYSSFFNKGLFIDLNDLVLTHLGVPE